MNIEKLVSVGHKVAVCEQTETSKTMNKRFSEHRNEGDEIKAVKREVAQICSIGTFFKNEGDLDYDTKYVLAFYHDQKENIFGYCYFDVSTLLFYMGSFKDDLALKQFRTLCV
jgi:DNA mismatch repair ATPase MutS